MPVRVQGLIRHHYLHQKFCCHLYSLATLIYVGIKTKKGTITIDVPCDRHGSFAPLPVRKGQTENGILDHQVIAQYSEGMTSREIIATIKEMYDVYISPTLVNHITDSVIKDVRQWQNKPLDGGCPIVFMDGIVVKVRDMVSG